MFPHAVEAQPNATSVPVENMSISVHSVGGWAGGWVSSALHTSRSRGIEISSHSLHYDPARFDSQRGKNVNGTVFIREDVVRAGDVYTTGLPVQWRSGGKHYFTGLGLAEPGALEGAGGRVILRRSEVRGTNFS